MSRKKSNFLIFNTQQILESVLCEGIQERHDEAALHAFCTECSSFDRGVKKMILKLQRYETSRLMINAVIMSLDTEKQNFIKLVYKEKLKQDTVADLMFLSKAQTNALNNSILNEMTEALRFRLHGDNDIFNLKKIINMREAMAELLLLIRKTDKKLQIVDKDWYTSLLTRYNGFSDLLDYIKNLSQTKPAKKETSTSYYIILYKLEHPEAEQQEIAAVFNCHYTTVGRSLSVYQKNVSKFLY